MTIEEQGVQLAMSMFRFNAGAEGVILDTKNALRRAIWQRSFGDFIIQSRFTGKLFSVEVKTERTYTGNLFVESWSSYIPADQDQSHARRGWIHTLECDYLLAIYLDTLFGFIIPFQSLQRWCCTGDNLSLKQRGYKEKSCRDWREMKQLNCTLGYPVPFKDFTEELGVRKYQFDTCGNWIPCESPVTQRAA